MFFRLARLLKSMPAGRVQPSRGAPEDTVCFRCERKGHYRVQCKEPLLPAKQPVPISVPNVDAQNTALVLNHIMFLLSGLCNRPAYYHNGLTSYPNHFGVLKHQDLNLNANTAKPAQPNPALLNPASVPTQNAVPGQLLFQMIADQKKMIDDLQLEVKTLKSLKTMPAMNTESPMQKLVSFHDSEQQKVIESLQNELKIVKADLAAQTKQLGEAKEKIDGVDKDLECQRRDITDLEDGLSAVKRERQNPAADVSKTIDHLRSDVKLLENQVTTLISKEDMTFSTLR